MRVIICEDDSHQRQLLQRLVVQYSISENKDIEIVLCTGKAEQAAQFIQTEKADCYILDIDLNSSICGLKLAQKIREKDSLSDIIFITSYAEKLKLTFKYKLAALDYIVKNNADLQGELFEALNSAYNKLDQLYEENASKYFTIKIGEYVRKINFNDIYYFATSSNAHKVILKEQYGVYEFYDKLSEIEKLLDERFFRCHRSCIVNLNYIESYNKKEQYVLMKNKDKCPVAFSKKKLLQSLI